MSSSEHCQASSLLSSWYTVVIRKMGESQVKVLKERAEKHIWLRSIVERDAQKKKKDYFNKTHARSCWKKYAFLFSRLWHKKVLTWDRIPTLCSVLFTILPLSHIQHLIASKFFQAWPWNSFLRHTQSCFEVSRALQGSAHMHHTRTTLTLTMITLQTTCKTPLKHIVSLFAFYF